MPVIFFIVVFWIGSLGTGAYVLASFVLPSGRALPGRVLALSLFTGFAVAYAIGLVAIFWDPYWIDNGVEERIHFPDHFFWASWGASVLQFATVPITVGLFHVVRGRRIPAAGRDAASSGSQDAS